MKFKGFVYLMIGTFLIASGCTPHSGQVKKSKQPRFHKPKNWDTPIIVSSKRSVSSTKKQDYSSAPVSNTNSQEKEKTKFTPVFSGDKNEKDAQFKPVFKATPSQTVNSREQMDGYASWYGPGFHGKLTANGERYDQNVMTAAHRILPMNTKLRVTNMENGKVIVVRINDRGPYKKNRILDLTKKGSKLLGFHEKGTARVRLDVIKFPPSYNPSKGLTPYKQVVIQLAAFKDQNRAGNYKAQLSRRYNAIPFMIAPQQNGSFHVVAGPFDSRKKATKISNALKSDGVVSFVRSYKK